MKRKTAGAMLTGFLLAFTPGCATMILRENVRAPVGGPKWESFPAVVYPVTVVEVMGIATGGRAFFPEEDEFSCLFASVCLLDLPFSIAFDTLFLPHDLYWGFRKWQRKAKASPPAATAVSTTNAVVFHDHKYLLVTTGMIGFIAGFVLACLFMLSHLPMSV